MCVFLQKKNYLSDIVIIDTMCVYHYTNICQLWDFIEAYLTFFCKKKILEEKKFF